MPRPGWRRGFLQPGSSGEAEPSREFFNNECKLWCVSYLRRWAAACSSLPVRCWAGDANSAYITLFSHTLHTPVYLHSTLAPSGALTALPQLPALVRATGRRPRRCHRHMGCGARRDDVTSPRDAQSGTDPRGALCPTCQVHSKQEYQSP